MKLLVVEDSSDEQQALQGALSEIEECGPLYQWFASETVAVDYLSDALYCLDRARFDAVLLDLQLPDSPMLLKTFKQIQSASPATPIIALLDSRDEALACRLLREGAQDVLLKFEIECAPLARAIRFAIERQRRSRALRAISVFDELTGLYSRFGFCALAIHEIRAARLSGLDLWLVLFETEGLPDSEEDRDLTIMDICDVLQHVFEDSALHGRVDAACFGLTLLGLARDRMDILVNDFRERVSAMHPRLTIGVVMEQVPDCCADLDRMIDQARRTEFRKTAMLAG
ncbi:MAG TPA: response regulator [Bryobacteraceae bacterium]|nr:response regulator [Bryobacteraceae bacterium]